MLVTWLYFAIAAGIIILAGGKITNWADELSERTGIQRGFMGVLLLGMVTSMPEVITSSSAVLLYNETDMAIGNLLGSCTFNLLIVVILDAMFRLPNAGKNSVATGYLSVIMLVLVLIGWAGKGIWPAFYLDPISLLIIIGYFAALHTIWRIEKQSAGEVDVADAPNDSATFETSLTVLIAKIALAGIVLIATSIWMAEICDKLATETGLGGTVVGTIFMALATSLPELTVSITAMRMGQMSLSLGNIYGSNIFNIGILGLVDILEGRGGLFAKVNTDHALVALMAIAMSLALLLGFRKMPRFHILRWRPASVVTGIIYIAGTIFLFYNALHQ